MIGLTYTFCLIVSTMCTLLVDYRFSLAFFYSARQTWFTVLAGTGVFIIWDILGIRLGIFLSGHSKYASGTMLGPNFPIEELLFLLFFCYFTLVLYRLVDKKW